eukprot:733064-Pleurochrysis_carterae.AAC.3
MVPNSFSLPLVIELPAPEGKRERFVSTSCSTSPSLKKTDPFVGELSREIPLDPSGDLAQLGLSDCARCAGGVACDLCETLRMLRRSTWPEIAWAMMVAARLRRHGSGLRLPWFCGNTTRCTVKEGVGAGAWEGAGAHKRDRVGEGEGAGACEAAWGEARERASAGACEEACAEAYAAACEGKRARVGALVRACECA